MNKKEAEELRSHMQTIVGQGTPVSSGMLTVSMTSVPESATYHCFLVLSEGQFSPPAALLALAVHLEQCRRNSGFSMEDVAQALVMARRRSDEEANRHN